VVEASLTRIVKRSTAIGRLGEVAESLDRFDWLDPKIVAGYVHGELETERARLGALIWIVC
jgi:hypothetical protein